MPIFRPERKIPLAAGVSINKELNSLEKIGVLSKFYNSEWASSTVSEKNKNNNIRVGVDFSTGLNDFLET